MSFSYKKTAIAVIAFTLIITILLYLIVYKNSNNNDNVYLLKENNNSVTLYHGEKPIYTYEGIVVSSLPYADRRRLKDGIILDKPEDAEAIIEDYDG